MKHKLERIQSIQVDEQEEHPENGPRLSDETKILEPYTYLAKSGGKQFRSQFVDALNYWFKLPKEKISIIQKTIEMLHNATLLFDDIEDNSALRRGAPTAHLVYGLSLTINAGNYVFFKAISEMLQTLPTFSLTSEIGTEIAQTILQTMMRLHLGQGWEIHWRDSYHCPSEEEYLEMINLKTGAFFELCVELLRLFAGKENQNNRNYCKLAHLIGTYFQVRDDYANLTQYEESKGFCEDITEGKFSFPMIFALQNATKSENDELIDILKQRTTEREQKKRAVELLTQSGALNYTENRLVLLRNQISEELNKLGGNSQLEELIFVTL